MSALVKAGVFVERRSLDKWSADGVECRFTILLSCGPGTLASLAATPGLIDEYLIAVHPAVLGDGPRLFDGLGTDLALRLLEAKVFDGGCVLQRYEVVPSIAGSPPAPERQDARQKDLMQGKL